MTAKHTPGPWYASRGRQPQIASETDQRGHTVALVYDHCSDEERDANARLIAAAPDIAASLSRCAFLLQRIWDGDHYALEVAVNAAHEARALLAPLGLDNREEER